MMQIRSAHERGHANHGWLDSHFTFSFADYFDPAQVGFRALGVMNEDRIQPGQGFGMHPHRDMEIVTYVLAGSLEHRDSMGHGSVLRAGELQRMTAGTGIRHSEFNPSAVEPVHLYQIWLLPERPGLAPGYEQKSFSDQEKMGRLRLVAAPDGREGALTIHQDASLFLGSLASGQTVQQRLAPGRSAWVQVLRGRLLLQGQTLGAGDGAALGGQTDLRLQALEPCEVLLFDLP